MAALPAAMPARIAVARLWHEGNSFTPIRTRLADFRSREWAAGEEVPKLYGGTRTEIGAAVDFFHANREPTPVWLRCTGAPPGGPVEEADLLAICDEIVAGIRNAGPDAVYLSLHGALLGSETLKADLFLLERVRQTIGARPLAVSFDLHANLDPEIAGQVDIIVGYKTYPHVDMYEAGAKALALLQDCLSQKISPVTAIAKVGAVLPSFKMRTAAGPMAEIEALAAQRTAGRILDVSPFGGFAYADTPCAGASVAVTADGERAQELAAELAQEMYLRRGQFAVSLPNPKDALLSFRKNTRPVAILEPSDNPLSGGVGDTTGLFRELVQRTNEFRAVFAFFWDPDLAARCQKGKRMRVQLGGRLSKTWGPPVELEVEVERVTDGRFRNSGPMETGLEVNLGPTAVLRHGALRIIVTSSCQSPNDAEYFRLHGIDLGQVDLVCAKAKNHFRAAFGTVFDPIVEVDTAGPAMANLAALPFKNLPANLVQFGA
jgi:microcystin degradation protein MlrC